MLTTDCFILKIDFFITIIKLTYLLLLLLLFNYFFIL